MGGDRLATADRIAFLIGPCLDVHDRFINAEHPGQRMNHWLFEGLESWPLGEDRYIDIHRPISGVRRDLQRRLDKNSARSIFPLRIVVGKMLADIPLPHCSEQRIDQRVGDDIPVAVRTIGLRPSATWIPASISTP